MNQAQRENVIRRLRNGQLEIVVATDVAARGWDVERIALVVNYQAPYDTESYVHRIGRTGRAGRAGRSILFVTPRQKRLLRDIERYTGQRLEAIKVPTRADVAARRVALFKERILNTAAEGDLELYLNLVEELAMESGLDMAEIAAAAACLARGDKPLEVVVEPVPEEATHTDEGMVRLFIDAGRSSGVRPADIVGAIANEANVPGNAIGAIDIYERFSFVDVPRSYLQQVLQQMDGATIRSRDVRIRVATPREEQAKPRKFFPKGKRGFQKSTKKVFRKGKGGR
jgi:ATP-dependent RNA helicase DeaD